MAQGKCLVCDSRVIAGTCAYQIAEAIAVRAGLQPSDLSAFTSALLLVTIGGSLLLGKGEPG